MPSSIHYIICTPSLTNKHSLKGVIRERSRRKVILRHSTMPVWLLPPSRVRRKIRNSPDTLQYNGQICTSTVRRNVPSSLGNAKITALGDVFSVTTVETVQCLLLLVSTPLHNG